MEPEILAPAGDWQMLSSAISAGADAVYFGVTGLNMRANAKNFNEDDLSKIVSTCHKNGVKAYMAVNTIVFDSEVKRLEFILKKAKQAGVDAIICWDLAVVKLAKEKKLPIHLSTQASAANSLALEEYKSLGIKRVILARECSLEQIKALNTSLEIEFFIHGAMCVAVSGRCFMSQYLYGKSANRGACIQPCRRKYLITDPETEKQLEIENHYVMSPKDLCTIDILDKLLDSPVSSFKIEGRNRSPEYVSIAVKTYKKAIKAHKENYLTDEFKKTLKNDLKKVYNRGFSTGFYLGTPINEWTDQYGSKSSYVKVFVGTIVNYYKVPKVAEIKLETGQINKGDKLLVQGQKTGNLEVQVESIQLNDGQVSSAKKGDTIGIKSPLIRKNDKVYVFKKRG
ncbi:MAG: U32 family peptidase [Nanobdellota archaeon]